MISWFKKVPSKHIDKSTTVGDFVWYWPRFEPEPFQVMVLELPSEKQNVKILARDQIKHIHISFLWIKKEDAVKGGPVIHMPIVKKVFPSLLAMEIVSVQPMTMPAGLTTFLDYSYGNTTNTKTQSELEPSSSTIEKEHIDSNS